jgi:lipopolysaccharide export system permease protein
VKKLDWLLLKSYIGPLVLTFFIALFVLDMMFLWKYVDDMIGKGIETLILIELMFYASATSVPMAFPLAVLVASIMTFGNFGEHFELTAIKSSGVSLFRFMRSLVLFSVFMSGLAFYFSNNILPIANLKFSALLYDVRHQKPALNFKEGIFNNDIENFSIKISSKSADQKTIYDVLIYDLSSGKGNDHVIIADSGKLSHSEDGTELIFTLFNGYQYKEEGIINEVDKPASHYRNQFETWEKKFDLSGFQMDRTDQAFFNRMHKMLNIKQLANGLDSVKMQYHDELLVMHKNLSNYFISNRAKDDTLGIFKAEAVDSIDFYADFLLKNNNYKQKVNSIATTKARNAKNIIDGKRDVLKYKIKDMVQYKLHMHQKFTLSVACIVLFFIGAPLGSIIKKGGFGFPMLWAVIFFVIYLVTSIIGEKTAEQMVITPWQGMWMSTFLLLPVGVFLTVKAKNDSPLFTTDFYKRFFKKKA